MRAFVSEGEEGVDKLCKNINIAKRFMFDHDRMAALRNATHRADIIKQVVIYLRSIYGHLENKGAVIASQLAGINGDEMDEPSDLGKEESETITESETVTVDMAVDDHKDEEKVHPDDSEPSAESGQITELIFIKPEPSLRAIHVQGAEENYPHPWITTSRRAHVTWAYAVIGECSIKNGIGPSEHAPFETLSDIRQIVGSISTDFISNIAVVASLDFVSSLYSALRWMAPVRGDFRGAAYIVRFSLLKMTHILDFSTIPHARGNGLTHKEARLHEHLSTVIVPFIATAALEEVYVLKSTSDDVKLLLSIKGNDHSEEDNFGSFALWREEFDGTTQFNSDSKQNKLFRRLLDKELTEKVKTKVLDGKQTRGNRVKVY